MIGLVAIATLVKTQLKSLCCPMTVRLHFQVYYLELRQSFPTPLQGVGEDCLINRLVYKGYYGQLLAAI